MAYETKVLLSVLADGIANAETVKEAYSIIRRAANVEGVQLPSYEERRAELAKDKITES